MQDDNYFVVKHWMINALNLTGNDLLIFALIYGFTQDGISEFKGGQRYITKLLKISKPTVYRSLSNLEDEGLISKRYEEVSEGINYPRFKYNDLIVTKLRQRAREVERNKV